MTYQKTQHAYMRVPLERRVRNTFKREVRYGTARKIRIAKRAIEKRWDFETLKYGDDLYGKEKFADEIWDLVEECDEIGQAAFRAKYPDA